MSNRKFEAMDLRGLLVDDEAVSPVIGVILMVAITVILAAVIGVFVLGIGQDNYTTPQTRFDYEFDQDANEVIVRHDGGDTLTSENSKSVDLKLYDRTGPDDIAKSGSFSVSSGISSGSSVTVTNAHRGDQLRIVWTAPDGSKTQVISEHEV